MGMGIDLYSPSFPSMEQAFQTTPRNVQLSITTYFIGFFLGLPLVGLLSDLFGRKKTLVAFLIYYAGISLILSFVSTIGMLLALRALQGIAGSVMITSYRSIFSDVFSGKELAKAMSYGSMSYRLSPIFAPVIGGYLQFFFGWQSNFLFLCIYALLLAFLFGFLIPETHTEKGRFTPYLLLRLYREVLSSKLFLGAAICSGLQYTMLLIFPIFAPFFLSHLMDYSPILYGHLTFVFGICAFLGILCNRLFLRWHNPLALVPIGVYLLLFQSALFCLLTHFFPSNLWSFLIPLNLLIIFAGFISSNMVSHALGHFPRGKGTAAALLTFVSVFVVILFTTVATFLTTSSSFSFATYYLVMGICTYLGYRLLFKKSLDHQ